MIDSRLVGSVQRAGSVAEAARWDLLEAMRGSTDAAKRLRASMDALVLQAAKGDAYACETLSAMFNTGLGARRNVIDARQWLARAVELLEGMVQPPVAGSGGFLLLPTDSPQHAYRPLYTADHRLITDEIGIASMRDGDIRFDRSGRPVLKESCEHATRATSAAVAARIGRESTLEDFSWACQHTTSALREKLLDSRVIARRRLRFEPHLSERAMRLFATVCETSCVLH